MGSEWLEALSVDALCEAVEEGWAVVETRGKVKGERLNIRNHWSNILKLQRKSLNNPPTALLK